MKNLWILVVLVIIVGGIFMWARPSSAPIVDQPTLTDTSAVTPPARDIGDNATGEPKQARPNIKGFTITATNFSFSLAEIKVKVGDIVRISFSNTEGLHDFTIDEFKINTKQLNAGAKEVIEFVVTKAGTFEYYCSVDRHRQFGMKGKLIVE
ncbi:MAG TPA: cupredoxin domain-containing protein [Candidatus Paceibacterota bacterium]